MARLRSFTKAQDDSVMFSEWYLTEHYVTIVQVDRNRRDRQFGKSSVIRRTIFNRSETTYGLSVHSR